MPRNTLWDWITCKADTVDEAIHIPVGRVAPANIRVPAPNITDESTSTGGSPSSCVVKVSSVSSPVASASFVGLELFAGGSPLAAHIVVEDRTEFDPELCGRTETSFSNPTVKRSGKVVYPSPPEPRSDFSAPKGALREIREEIGEEEDVEAEVIEAGAGVGSICCSDFATNRQQLIQVHARRDSLILPDGTTVTYESGVYKFEMAGLPGAVDSEI